MDVTLHQQARARVANLTTVVKNTPDGAVYGSIQIIKIRQKNLRAFATGFQCHALHVGLPGVAQQQLANSRRARERKLDDIRVQGQGFARLGAMAVNQVEHAGWTTRLNKQFDQARARQRRLFRWLEHHAVARSQNGRDLPHGHQHGVVPRCDGTDHPQRLVNDHVQGGGIGVRDGTLDLVNALREIADGFQHFGNVDAQHIADGLAHVQCFQQRQLIAVLRHQIGKALQHLHARARGQTTPATVFPGSLRAGNSGVDIRNAAQCHLCNNLPVRRIHAIKRSAVLCGNVTSINEQPCRNRQTRCQGGPAIACRGRC